MNPDDLLSGAPHLLHRKDDRRPKQADLRRALSSVFYALFHALAQCCADAITGGESSALGKRAWRQVYRALDHGYAKGQCSNFKITKTFPKEIEDFARSFAAMQIKRHEAD